MWRNSQIPANLVIFTEEILNGSLMFGAVDVNDIILVSLLLILNTFHTFFKSFSFVEKVNVC